jgi:hypothetical protein
MKNHEVCGMQTAEVVLGVLRERGRKGLPCTQLYRQMFNRELYLAAYGKIYSNQGAMTPGVGRETADGMSEEKIDQIIEAMRHERYRFAPARRVHIPKKNGKLRPFRRSAFRIPQVPYCPVTCAPSPCGPVLPVSRLGGRHAADYYGHSVSVALADLRRSHVHTAIRTSTI